MVSQGRELDFVTGDSGVDLSGLLAPAPCLVVGTLYGCWCMFGFV